MEGMADIPLLVPLSCPRAVLQPSWVPSVPLLTHPGSKRGKLSSAPVSPVVTHLQQGSGGLPTWPSFPCLHCAWQSCAPAADVCLSGLPAAPLSLLWLLAKV